MSSDDGLPISNLEDGNPVVDEVDEVEVDEVDMDISSELSSDNGGYNELVLMNDSIKNSFDLGDSYIVLLDSRENPFLANVIEIDIGENLLKMEDDTKKVLIFNLLIGFFSGVY